MIQRPMPEIGPQTGRTAERKAELIEWSVHLAGGDRGAVGRQILGFGQGDD